MSTGFSGNLRTQMMCSTIARDQSYTVCCKFIMCQYHVETYSVAPVKIDTLFFCNLIHCYRTFLALLLFFIRHDFPQFMISNETDEAQQSFGVNFKLQMYYFYAKFVCTRSSQYLYKIGISILSRKEESRFLYCTDSFMPKSTLRLRESYEHIYIRTTRN